MARYEHLPIDRSALDLAVHLERVVAGFSRHHKCSLGSELRQASRAVVLRIIEANGPREGRAEALLQLRGQPGALTLLLRLARELKAFQSFAAWQHCVEQVSAVG